MTVQFMSSLKNGLYIAVYAAVTHGPYLSSLEMVSRQSANTNSRYFVCRWCVSLMYPLLFKHYC